MDNPTKLRRDHKLAIGFLAGAAVGVGVMMWLAPRAVSELRQRVTDAARGIRKRTTDRYEEATAHVDEVMDELARKGQAIRDDAAETVARGAREVERRATAAKSDRVSG
jgi:gas vesicle protein